MFPSRVSRSLKNHLPDLLALGSFVGVPSWIVPAWKGYRASRKLINGEVELTVEDLQNRIDDLAARIGELEKRIP